MGGNHKTEEPGARDTDVSVLRCPEDPAPRVFGEGCPYAAARGNCAERTGEDQALARFFSRKMNDGFPPMPRP